MTYELRDALRQGKEVFDEITDTITVYANITVGIVGETYGFTKTTTEIFIIEDVGAKSYDELKTEIEALFFAKVAELYPNT